MAYDSQLRRKRSFSTTRERPPRPSASTSSDGHSRNHSTSLSIPSAESQESIPPLPSGTSHPTLTVFSTPTAHEFSSSTRTITKNQKRESLPPFSNLMVYTPSAELPSDYASSPSSTSASTSKPANPSPIVPTRELPARSSSLRRVARLEITPPNTQMSSTEIEQPFLLPSTGKSVLPEDKMPPTQKTHAHSGSIHVSSSPSPPITPMLFAPSHQSSPNHSPTSRSFSFEQGSSRSSLKRNFLSAYSSMEHLAFQSSSSPVSPRMSSKTLPPHEIISPIKASSSNQKRSRNVLRKPSVHANRDPPADPQDTDKSGPSSKSHRQRAKSVTISPTRSGAMFDVSQPLPTNALNLTPAGAIQAAYQESQRRSGNTPVSSGKVVAVGVPDHGDFRGRKNQWIITQSNNRSIDDHAMDTQVLKGTESVKNVLARKLSAKWGKTTEKQEERYHAMSASVTGLPDNFIHDRPYETKASMSRPVDVLVGLQSRGLGSSKEQGSSGHDEGQGRVWEDTVDDWVINRQPDPPKKSIEAEKEKGKNSAIDTSNPRRLWKLVKRLSSGNLKERRQPSTEEPPPVPPLPKGLVRGSVDHQDDNDMTRSSIPEPPKGLMRYISSIPALTIPSPQGASTTKWTSPQELAPSSSSPRSQTGVGPRRLRSETTRSSSPSSGTTGFFSRSRSSSTSSYGETLPPMPDMPFAHNIKHLPQARATPEYNEKGDRYTVKRNSKSPPRRKSHDVSSTGSATIPWFDAQNPINKFIKGRRPQYPPLSALHIAGADRERVHVSRRPSTANASSSAPPVPPRSPKRPSTANNGSAPTMDNIRKFSTPNAATIRGASLSEDRQHLKSRPRSVSDGIVESSASMTFREMKSLKQPLSEAEKAAKWEDLLNRSAKAGGTLHVVPRTDSSVLWSDNNSFTTAD